MKELSIKEKAYDGNYKVYTELINRLENVKNAIKKQNYGIAMDILYKPYPEYQITTSTELKECEDLRITKAIKYGLDHVFTNNTTVFEVTKEQCLSWLEKQGEHSNFLSKIQVGDKVTRNEDGVLVNLSQLNRVAKKQCEQKPIVNDNAKEMFIKALERVEEQNAKGYKLTDCDKNSWWEDFKAYTSCTIEQKPAWSEEDERKINYLIALLQNSTMNDDALRVMNEEVENWLKSLRPQKKQYDDEWSDEDINMIDWLIRCCEKEHEELCNDRYGHQEIVSDLKRDCRKKWDWLESLKGKVAPQSQWKPSDEQMDALHYVTNFDYGGHKATLVSLYEQLKKLKG